MFFEAPYPSPKERDGGAFGYRTLAVRAIGRRKHLKDAHLAIG